MERQKFNFDYSVYGNRVPSPSAAKTSVERANWSMEKGQIEAEIEQALTSIAPQYESISATDDPLTGWDKTSLQSDPSVLCTIYKRPYHQPGQTELAIELSRWGDERIYFAAFYIKHKNEYPWEWEIAHREVHKDYQDNRIFSETLAAMENFVQEFGSHKQERQRITLELGQPMVVARFLNKGYEPVPEDREKVEAMLDGSNEHYFCEYAHAKSPRTGQIIKMDDIDPFCFDNRTVNREQLEKLHPGNSVRVILEKNLSPQLREVSDIADSSRAQLQKRTGQE